MKISWKRRPLFLFLQSCFLSPAVLLELERFEHWLGQALVGRWFSTRSLRLYPPPRPRSLSCSPPPIPAAAVFPPRRREIYTPNQNAGTRALRHGHGGHAARTGAPQVLANADTPEQAATGRSLGAQGIGLCRSEHMFFAPERISAMRAMIVSSEKEERLKHLETMATFQREDIAPILK